MTGLARPHHFVKRFAKCGCRSDSNQHRFGVAKFGCRSERRTITLLLVLVFQDLIRAATAEDTSIRKDFCPALLRRHLLTTMLALNKTGRAFNILFVSESPSSMHEELPLCSSGSNSKIRACIFALSICVVLSIGQRPFPCANGTFNLPIKP